MFIATAINFLLSSLNTGNQVAIVIMFIGKARILNIDHPLSEKPELVKDALQNMNIIDTCGYLPLSGNLLLPDSLSNNTWRRYCSAI